MFIDFICMAKRLGTCSNLCLTPGAVNFSNCLNRLVFTYRYFASKSSLSDSLSNSKHNVNWNICILVKKHDMELRGVN